MIMNIENICKRYNNYVSAMVENAKRITSEEKLVYHTAFEGKKSIEKTLGDLGLHIVFNEQCFAINIIEKW